MVNNFQLVLFDKYTELLQRQFGERFQEVGRSPNLGNPS
jgi:hypothetical protein